MDDSFESASPWLLLLHHLPPKPDYFRVRVRRQLQQLGAIGLKNAAYVLPYSTRSLDEFEVLASQIRRDGGEAMVVRAGFVSGVTSEELIDRFQELSNTGYAGLIASARASTGVQRPEVIARLERQWESIRQRDAFEASGGMDALAALQELRRQIEARAAVAQVAEKPSAATWIIQQGVSIDRIASAWVILRFVDRSARFRFVPARGFRPAPGDVLFGPATPLEAAADHTSMEWLIDRFGLSNDVALKKLSELIRDLEPRNDQHRWPETPGLRALFQGVIARYGADAERLEHGRRILDQLYTHFTRQSV